MSLALHTLYGAEDLDGGRKSSIQGIELLKANRALLQKIIDTYHSIDKGGQYDMLGQYYYATKAIGRIFEHSIKDGIYLAETLNLDPSVLLMVVTRPEFIVKHQKFCQGMLEKVRQAYVRYYPDLNMAPRIIRALYKIFEACSDVRGDEKIFDGIYYFLYSSSPNPYPFPTLCKDKPISWTQVEKARLGTLPQPEIDSNDPDILEIDEHYSDFLQAKRFDSANDDMPTVEKRAEEHLKTIGLVMHGAYYAGAIKTLFISQVDDEFSRRRISTAFANLPHQDLLTLEEIEEVAAKLKIEMKPLLEKINRSKYFLAKGFYIIERNLLVKLILEELKKNLTERLGEDIKIVQDPISKGYRVTNLRDVDQTLNVQEESLLELLDCIESPTVKNISEYFTKKRGGTRTTRKTITHRVWRVFSELFGSSEKFRKVALYNGSVKSDRKMG